MVQGNISDINKWLHFGRINGQVILQSLRAKTIYDEYGKIRDEFGPDGRFSFSDVGVLQYRGNPVIAKSANGGDGDFGNYIFSDDTFDHTNSTGENARIRSGEQIEFYAEGEYDTPAMTIAGSEIGFGDDLKIDSSSSIIIFGENDDHQLRSINGNIQLSNFVLGGSEFQIAGYDKLSLAGAGIIGANNVFNVYMAQISESGGDIVGSDMYIVNDGVRNNSPAISGSVSGGEFTINIPFEFLNSGISLTQLNHDYAVGPRIISSEGQEIVIRSEDSGGNPLPFLIKVLGSFEGGGPQ